MRFALAVTLLTSSSSSTTMASAFMIPLRSSSSSSTSSSSTTTVPTRHGIAFVPSPSSTRLFGILDEIESGAYDLSTTGQSEETDVAMNDAYEMFLADLVFSTNDPRVDIMNDYDRATDETWLTWLNNKIQASRDPEERIALRDLYEMIMDIQTSVKVSQLAQERQAAEAAAAEEARIVEAEAQAEAGRSMSNSDVLRKASAIDDATTLDAKTVERQKLSFYEQEITPEIRLSYEKLLQNVLPPYAAGDTPKSIVFKYYDQFDAQFVKVLNERVTMQNDADSAALLEALALEQQARMTVATTALKAVLALGEPMRMEGAIVRMAREGKVDEPFLLLLEANATQARDAGALGAAQFMDKLRQRALEEKDKQASSKEIRLIRKLLRTRDSGERDKILEDAFTPRDVLLVAGTAENAQKAVDGELPDEQKPMPDVSPPDFINACKAVLLNFGNLGSDDDDRGDLSSRIKAIASEAEVVATRIYGKGMSLREQQDRAWKEQTTSIFDLETMEIEAERMGETAPWANPDAGDEILPGFDASGKMRIGGL